MACLFAVYYSGILSYGLSYPQLRIYFKITNRVKTRNWLHMLNRKKFILICCE